MIKTNATWKLDLDVTCPECGEYFDILPEYGEQECHTVLAVGESKKLDITEGREDLVVNCPSCDVEMAIEETEY